MKTVVTLGLFPPEGGILEKYRQEGFDFVFPLGPGGRIRHDEDRETVFAALRDADGFISGGMRVDDALLDQAPGLEAVVFCGVGYASFIDAAACTRHGVALGICPGANAVAVAESASAMLCAAIKDLVSFNGDVKNGYWRARKTPDIFDKTLGFAGLGNVGMKMARIMHGGYGTRILYCARSAKPEAEKELGAERRELDALLEESDVTIVSLPWTRETEKLIDAERVARMKDGAILLNLARAEIVDTQAVLSALETGKLSKYITDVFHSDVTAEKEAPLWKGKYPDDTKCIVTPHTFWASPHTERQTGIMAVETMKKLLDGGATPNRVEI